MTPLFSSVTTLDMHPDERNSPATPRPILYFRSGAGIILGHTMGPGTRDGLMRSLAEAFPDATPLEPFWLDQVHGSRIVSTASHPAGSGGDGFFLDTNATVGMIRTADCTPLFFRHAEAGIAGLLHVGWRGLAGGILANLTDDLARRGLDFLRLDVWLGPAIDGPCYPVGGELPERFPGPSPEFWGFSRSKNGNWTLDVRRGITNALRAAGIPQTRIRRSPVCTFCDPRFPSYRRQGAGSGRILNFMLRHPGGTDSTARVPGGRAPGTAEAVTPR